MDRDLEEVEGTSVDGNDEKLNNNGEGNVTSNTAGKAREGSKSSTTVHYLPCGIKYDGPTDVNSFFRISKSDKDSEVLVSHFRGRELKGQVVHLPENVSGLCITPGKDDPRRWEVTGEFKDLTLWQHDLTPDVAQMEDLLNYFEISSAVHA
jgi:ribonuclease H2 subunit C